MRMGLKIGLLCVLPGQGGLFKSRGFCFAYTHSSFSICLCPYLACLEKWKWIGRLLRPWSGGAR